MEYSEIVESSNFLSFSPDSSFFIYYNQNRLIIKQSSVELRTMAVIDTPGQISAAISPNSLYVAIFIHKKSGIYVYRVEDSKLMAKIQDPQAGIVSFFWTKDSTQILVFSQYMYKVSIYNLSENNMCYIKGPKLSSEKGCVFTSDGKFMALIERHDCKDFLRIYYTHGWKLINNIPLQLFDAVQVQWAPNDSYLIVWDNCINYRMLVICHVRGPILKYEPYQIALGIKTVQFSSKATFLAIGSFDEKIRLLNTMTWAQIGVMDCSNVSINPQQVAVYKEEDTNNTGNRIKFYDGNSYKIPTVKVIFSTDKNQPNQGIGLMEFSHDENYIACRNDNMPYTVWIWDVSKMQPISIISCNTHIKSLKWNNKNNVLSIASGTDRILFWDSKGCVGDCAFTFQGKKINIQSFKWSSDGTKMVIYEKNQFAFAELTPQGFL